MARLSSGDPLQLAERTSRRLREVWVLLEPDRVFHRALAVCAHAATLEQPPVNLSDWTRSKIDLAIEQLMSADHEAEHANPGVTTEEQRSFPLLTQSLMRAPEDVRAMTVAFNALDPLPRRAFFELMIESRLPVEVIESGPWDADGLLKAIQVALATLDLGVMPSDQGERKRGEKP